MGLKFNSATSILTGSLQMLILPLLSSRTTPQYLMDLYSPRTYNPPNNQLNQDHSVNLTWERIVAGFILLLIGIILTFRGYRHYRFTVFLAGFITGCWNHSQVIYVFGCIGDGLIIGAICWLFTPFLVWILGGVAGLAVALYTLAWRSQGLIRAKGGRIGLLIGAPVLGLIIALVLGPPSSVPTSRSSFFTTDSKVDYKLTTNMYIMLGVIGGLTLLGLTFQALSWRHRRQALMAQGRPLHDHDNYWSIFGRNQQQQSIRPDSTYSNTYGASGYNAGYNAGYNNNNNNNNNNVDETVYTEKRNWNPFRKNKEVATTSTTTATTTTTAPAPAVVHSDYPEDNRVSYSSNAALNQNQ
ncbi:MAG: hypothetical protein J3Q66DRAFT_420715 [Benniella sp.]|nr:MAG: hypothetical protein J3Q66DRAFT_420715 [Benniella sp.]